MLNYSIKYLFIPFPVKKHTNVLLFNGGSYPLPYVNRKVEKSEVTHKFDPSTDELVQFYFDGQPFTEFITTAGQSSTNSGGGSGTSNASIPGAGFLDSLSKKFNMPTWQILLIAGLGGYILFKK